MTRPVIGVTGPDRGGLTAWWFTHLALFCQGARAVRITPQRDGDIDALDGLIIGGGADIDPENYGVELEIREVREAVKQTPERNWLKWFLYPFIYMVRRLFSKKNHDQHDAVRDQMELSLIETAREKQLPILGICRGAQLINVSLGGSLHDDIREYYEEEPLPRSIFPVKTIVIEPKTLLNRILDLRECSVNALHHQAIDKLGEGISISAYEANRIVQAIEAPDPGFMIGVQWHPEYLPLDETQRRLFRALVDAARKRKHPS